jgi:adenosylcobinamide-phosphate synthase
VYNLLALPLGFVLDLLLGDRENWPHPVRWIGRLTQFLEPWLRRVLPARWAGVCLLLIVVAWTGLLTWGVLALAAWLHPVAHIATATLLVYLGVSARTLAEEARKVVELETAGQATEARRQLARIVGRDTARLQTPDVYRACIETVAESTCDGVVAPLFYAALAGPVGMWGYKAINTLDSMVGHRDERYLHFGWASARADDLANFLPARLTWLLLALAAAITRQDGSRALRIGWRDGRQHPSPNAGWPEATMAGALGVQLGGPSTYDGVAIDRPVLGDPGEKIEPDHVRAAVKVMEMAAWLALGLACLLAMLVGLAFGSAVPLLLTEQAIEAPLSPG